MVEHDPATECSGNEADRKQRVRWVAETNDVGSSKDLPEATDEQLEVCHGVNPRAGIRARHPGTAQPVPANGDPPLRSAPFFVAPVPWEPDSHLLATGSGKSLGLVAYAHVVRVRIVFKQHHDPAPPTHGLASQRPEGGGFVETCGTQLVAGLPRSGRVHNVRSAGLLVRAAPGDDGRERAQHQANVRPQRPVGHVHVVELDHLVEGDVRPAQHLPETGEPGVSSSLLRRPSRDLASPPTRSAAAVPRGSSRP